MEQDSRRKDWHGRHQRQRQRQHKLRRRSRHVILGVLQLAIAVAIHASTLKASAFSVGPPLSTIPGSYSVSLATSCEQRKSLVTLGAKKRRKKSFEGDADEEVRYRESAKEFSNQKNVINDRADGEVVSDANRESPEGISPKPKQTTLSGGTPLIFEMARRMLVWDDELYESGILNDAGSREGEEASPSISPTTEYLTTLPSTSSSLPPSIPTASSTSLPRWRPSAIRQQSISNINPSFRTSSPIMTNAGYAGILRRNSRKKNKPSMWRHCLRVYSRMGELEREYEAAYNESNVPGATAETTGVDKKQQAEGGIPGVGTNLSSPKPTPRNTKRKRVRRSTAHHEAALVAASKLGLWEESLLIYRGVESSVLNGTAKDVSNSTTGGKLRIGRSRITDNMILSVISACIKGSKVKRTASSIPDVNDAVKDEEHDDTSFGNSTESNSEVNDGSNITYAPPPPSRPMMRALTVEERRKPLDMARDIILSMEKRHDIPLVARHINPLASAYNRLGLRSESAALINDHLKDRTPPPPAPRKLSSKKSKEWKEKRELTSESPGFETGVKLVDWREDDLDDDSDDEFDDEYNDGYEEMQLNIHQMKSKDRASYSLLVQGAAMDGDWTAAVQELQRMTDAGLHPNSRNLNSWNEVMERGCRPSGNGENDDENNDGSAEYYYGLRQRRRSWKKRRDGIWLGHLR